MGRRINLIKMRKKDISLAFLVLILSSFLFWGLTINSVGEIRERAGVNVTNEKIAINQTVYYNFTDYNVQYGFHTDSNLNINIGLGVQQTNDRELFLDIINDGIPVSLNLTSKSSLSWFNLPKTPKNPSGYNSRFQYKYNNIIKIQVNTTVNNLTARFEINQKFGLSRNKEYRITLFKEDYDSWEILSTESKKNESTNVSYLEANLTNLNESESYYITIFEVSSIGPQYDWFWIVIISGSAIGIGALAIIISKTKYFEMLKTRIVSIDKGAHRLTMEEVLENENRNKIIECILEEPGIHYNELLRNTELSAGNLAWHLDILETYKIIGKKRVGKYLVYFPYYQKNPISNIDLKLQKSELTLKTLEMIESNPGTYNNEIAKDLNVDHKTISYHINKLKDLDLIYSKKDGRKKKLFPNLDAEYFKNNYSK
ncbi:MAG: winged helix-turn-helix transcriptional regulator [Promethearchaeota archaeon]|nr:MAG: winged helix-turn-helix transcriptional regulator [Candidatus Lokiarchaeota archaeon]